MQDKIRAALNKPITLNLKDASVDDVLTAIKAQVPEVPFHSVVDRGWGKGELARSFQLGQLPLAVYLQAVEDSFQISGSLRFFVRDYGILVTLDGGPPGALPLRDFWKSRPGDKLPKDTRPSPGVDPTVAPTPPDVEGLVKAINDQAGFVTISIGSDAGLRPGHTLEVFRTSPEPKYLGTLQIVSVAQTESFAKHIWQASDKLHIGDRVTSNKMSR
jgi:hypothetical protein